jgi:hypothetical protein
MKSVRNGIANGLAVVVLGGLLAAASPAFAVPPGSYLNSCQNVATVGNSIKAQCRKKSGAWRGTWLWNFPQCAGDIANNDGRLVCARPAGVAGGPAGSYAATCLDIHRIGSTLFALCKKKAGTNSYQATSLTLGCRGDIANNDGNLVCNFTAPQPPTSGGGGSSPFPGCRFSRTEIKCYGLVETCNNVYNCGFDSNFNPIDKQQGEYVCGGCFGLPW